MQLSTTIMLQTQITLISNGQTCNCENEMAVQNVEFTLSVIT